MLSGDSQVPRVHVTPRRGGASDGDLAASFAASYGLDPDEWQRLVLEDWLRVVGSRWASLTCGLAVPRQNGKNALIEIRELYGMVALGERILHTAHEVKTAQKHFRRLKYFFGQKAGDEAAQFPELNSLVTQVRSVNGQEAIFLQNGGSVELVARSKNSGRGFTVDVLVMDEAQEMAEDALEALMPTTSAAPLGNPQWIFTGTPPGPNASGEVFTRVRREALGEKPGRLSWHEWSVDGTVDLDDRGLWRMTNPALDAGRLQVAVIEGERSRFSDEGFARERLGRWSTHATAARLISPEEWEDTAVGDAPEGGVKSFGVAFSFDGSRVAVAGAASFEETVHVEIVASRSGEISGSVSALADWLAERWRDTARIGISGRSHATVLAEALYARGVPRKVVHVLATGEVFTAAGMLVDGVREQSVTHWADEGQRVLDDAVAVACKKHRGADGQWAFASATPDGDETPVEAVSFALWAAKTAKRVPGRKQVIL